MLSFCLIFSSESFTKLNRSPLLSWQPNELFQLRYTSYTGKLDASNLVTILQASLNTMSTPLVCTERFHTGLACSPNSKIAPPVSLCLIATISNPKTEITDKIVIDLSPVLSNNSTCFFFFIVVYTVVPKLSCEQNFFPFFLTCFNFVNIESMFYGTLDAHWYVTAGKLTYKSPAFKSCRFVSSVMRNLHYIEIL